MAYKGLFVGVGKHQDPLINDLAGAKRDAVALWSLFEDNVEGIKAELLVDEQATHENVLSSLSRLLADAEKDDTVFISFAGHGSEDHRLVVFDTKNSADEFEATSIAMADLANLFSRTTAKAVVCILDCCFSGGAGARVFTGRPVARSYKNPYAMISGNGRILIAACAIDESAYEDPSSSHGIMTKALLEALQALEEPTEFLAVAANLAQLIRSRAAALGVNQNPAILGHVEGGLTFSTFTKGQRYFEFFPDYSKVLTDGTIASLQDFRFPATVVAAWSERFRGEALNALQVAAINEKRVLEGNSLLVVAPTSSGKTFIGEVSALKGVLEGRKTVFLLPYKALTNEKFDEFSGLYSQQLGLRVIRCTGDRTDTVPQFIRGKYDLALLTYEMFLGLVVTNPHILRMLGLIVIDEVQFITDPSRGISVELLLTYLRAWRNRGVSLQLVALSAVIGGISYFDEWLGSEKLITDERPVPLEEGVLDRSGTWQYVDASGAVQRVNLLTPGSVVQRKDKPGSQDVIVPLVRKLLNDDASEKILIFRNQRGSAQGCANYLAQELGLPAATIALEGLPGTDLSDASQGLREAFTGGTAFHTSNLSRDEKQIVERVYRDPASPVRVLAATTGVAAGINTPASTVIIAEQEFLGEDGRPFTVAEYKNMAGRAGRKGFNEKGKSIILANTPSERERLFSTYVVGNLEHLRSSFDDGDLPTWVLKLLTQVGEVKRDEVANLLAATYGGFLNVRRNPDWVAIMQREVEQLLERMITLEVVELINGSIHLTLLGGACGRSSFSFGSAMRLIELLKQQDASLLTPERLMAILQVLPEADEAVYTPMFKKGSREQVRSHEVQQRYGRDVARLLQRGAGSDSFKWLARCKRAAILWDWINGVEIAEIEKTYSPTPYAGAIRYGHIIGFANTTRYHLRSVADILQVLILDAAFDADRFDRLLIQLEEGLPEHALELLRLPILLTRGEMLELHRQGLASAEALKGSVSHALASILGKARADELLVKLSGTVYSAPHRE
jgi:replicative superfamily II helicase